MATDSTLIRAGQFTQVARQGAIILVALALPRLGVGREVIGEWEGLLYLGYILGFGWLTGLLQAYLVTVRTTKNTGGYSHKVLSSVLLASLLLLALAAGLHEYIFRWLRLGVAPVGWGFFFVFLLSQWPGMFFEQLLQVRGRAWALAGFGLFSAAGYVAAVVLPILLGGDLADALFWLAVFAGAKGLIMLGWLAFDWRRGRIGYAPEVVEASGRGARVPGNGQGAGVRNLWRTATPLIVYATVGGLVTAFDPWFVNYWYDDDESLFAIFRYGARDIPFVSAVTNGMIVVILPLLTENVPVGLDQLKRSSRRIFHWIFGGVTLLMLTAPYWWTFAFTELFAEGLPLFRFYLFITVSRLLFPMPIIVALGYTRGLWLFSFSELVMNVVLSILLAPAYGLWGILLATVIADIVNKGILMAYLYRRAGILPARYMDLRVFLGWWTVLIVVWVFF
ncbi:lipopolysaccharide biosynthesis protein [Neolewinella antarctica]|uniref:O-antigen/teichoic acid export membrane protein n=1 Tax=Neolewinella antarctica TaxID=442734 RepID=A0ABX0X9X1_9BACT|nr:hypothetical protein [Neolewinella antarctica]NJC26002.1 O-antigen/teichoic acid export membrane protein [Neolewinella antarctica]